MVDSSELWLGIQEERAQVIASGHSSIRGSISFDAEDWIRAARRQAQIEGVTDLVVPRLVAVAEHHAPIVNAREWDLVEAPVVHYLYGSEKFLDQSVVSLRWGHTFRPTDDEQEVLDSARRGRISRSGPESIVAADYNQVVVTIGGGYENRNVQIGQHSPSLESALTQPRLLDAGIAWHLENPGVVSDVLRKADGYKSNLQPSPPMRTLRRSIQH